MTAKSRGREKRKRNPRTAKKRTMHHEFSEQRTEIKSPFFCALGPSWSAKTISASSVRLGRWACYKWGDQTGMAVETLNSGLASSEPASFAIVCRLSTDSLNLWHLENVQLCYRRCVVTGSHIISRWKIVCGYVSMEKMVFEKI